MEKQSVFASSPRVEKVCRGHTEEVRVLANRKTFAV